MVTIIDPNGSPTAVYNRSGVSIVEEVAAHQPGTPPPPSIMADFVSGHTIVLIDTTANESNAIQMPANTDIGDIVELYGIGPTDCSVFMSFGETINSQTNIMVSNSSSHGIVIRKVSATSWRSQS